MEISYDLSNYPITWDARIQAWELCDMLTGEIVSFDSERAARAARALQIATPDSCIPMDAPGRVFPGWYE